MPSGFDRASINDLGGKRVLAATGTTSLQTLFEDLAPHAIPYPVPERTDCLVDLQQGLVDAITSDDSILLGLEAQDPYTKIVGTSLAQEQYGMVIEKHPSRLRQVRQWRPGRDARGRVLEENLLPMVAGPSPQSRAPPAASISREMKLGDRRPTGHRQTGAIL